ncbi:SAM-dependent methyltransferase [Nonomuraea soli]|uniref:Trans-aconitate methyltransferase n=1 Tax=Nonomuraea soli TaxID=1032476 RepID=A0A7W0CK30_9ACTN|nr:SAM-dependent methyltransferase [Nonomuraea soli]MBA2892400.1 trans-aconitate methyltransferase [Nonomuraea soli]
MEIDSTTPSVARIYDFFLDGKNHYEADRVAAEQIIRAYPNVRQLARENRAFLGRAVRHMRACGVEQFLDLGTGLPATGNVHEVAGPDARVVYVDNDPIVAAHGRALLENTQAVLLQRDVRDAESVLADAASHLDFSRPVGVLFVAILHFIPEGAHELVARFREALVPGSFLAITHGFWDEETEADPLDVYKRTNAPVTVRTRGEILTFFGGFELVEPGLVDVSHWRPDEPEPSEPSERLWLAAGVARRP